MSVEMIIFILLFLISTSAADFHQRRRRAAVSGKNKNYDLCSRVFDVSNATIIKTSESLKNGARYLSSVSSSSREACESSCCNVKTCNVAVLEKKSSSAGGDCFLFDCGSLDDFKCIFAFHNNYVTLGMIVNRGDLEKTRIHEQAKHEMDLKILKTPPAQESNKSPSATVAPVKDDKSRDRAGPQPSPAAQPWANAQDTRAEMEDAQGENSMSSSDRREKAGKNARMRQNKDPVAESQRTHKEDGQSDTERRKENEDSLGHYQPPADPPSYDSSRSLSSDFHKLNPDRELQRKRPPVMDSPDAEAQKIEEPTSLINAKIGQPQHPPMFPQSDKPRSCGRFQWPCASGGRCIAEYDRCNGIAQCADGSDEAGCDQPLKPANNVQPQGANGISNSEVYQPKQSSPQDGTSRIQQNTRPWQASRPSGKDNAPDSQHVGRQQPSLVSQQSDNGVEMQSQWQERNRMGPPLQQTPTNQRNEYPIPEQTHPKLQQQANPVVNDVTNLAAPAKTSRVEFISIQKLDASATGSGGERASLAVVMLGFGMVMLAILLLYLSCRLRKIRRRLRRGKVLDTEEGEYLVNDMYL